MNIIESIKKFIYKIICFFFNHLEICKLIEDPKLIDDPNTCNHEESRDYTINYTDELNSDSSNEDIKNFIISSLETSYPGVFSLSEGDDNNLTDEMKKELIIILENSSSSIRFKFCCQSGVNCLR
jgi:hypothetical protein